MAMNRIYVSILALLLLNTAYGREDLIPGYMEKLVGSLRFEPSGTVILNNGVGKISIPAGYKYLEPSQSEKVLTELWGNPRNGNMTLGLLLPADHSLLNDNCCVINVQYDEIGYVPDDNADAIDYKQLLAQMQKESVEENELRRNAGLEPVSILGWAFPPYYDNARKVLHIATEVKVGSSPVHTLNYKMKFLGRKGVMVLHAIAPMADLERVRTDLAMVASRLSFSDAYQYQSFNPEQDQVSANDMGGLISGNILSHIKLRDLFYKYWTVLVILFVAFYRPVYDEVRRYFKPEKGNLSLP